MACSLWHQAVTWTNADFSLVRFCNLEHCFTVPKLLICVMSLKIILSNLLLHLPGAIELSKWKPCFPTHAPQGQSLDCMNTDFITMIHFSFIGPRKMCVIFSVISEHMLQIKFMSTSCEISPRWMPQDFTDDDISTMVQVMAWCHGAPSHYLSQCWPRSEWPYGVTRPQWVKH